MPSTGPKEGRLSLSLSPPLFIRALAPPRMHALHYLHTAEAHHPARIVGQRGQTGRRHNNEGSRQQEIFEDSGEIQSAIFQRSGIMFGAVDDLHTFTRSA